MFLLYKKLKYKPFPMNCVNQKTLFRKALHVMGVSDALQLIATLKGLKPVFRTFIGEEDSKELESLCCGAGLDFVYSKFKCLDYPRTQDKSSAYSVRMGKRVSRKSKKHGRLIIYISKSGDLATEACALEGACGGETGKHAVQFGRLLGYPECCIKFWTKYCHKYNLEPIIPSIKSFKSYPFYNNISLKYFDIRLIPHFPCSGDCSFSATIGKRNLMLLRKLNVRHALRFEKMLKTLVLFTQNNGIFLINKYKRHKSTFEFKEFLSSSSSSPIEELLSENGQFTVHNERSIEIGGNLLNRDMVTMIYR